MHTYIYVLSRYIYVFTGACILRTFVHNMLLLHWYCEYIHIMYMYVYGYKCAYSALLVCKGIWFCSQCYRDFWNCLHSYVLTNHSYIHNDIHLATLEQLTSVSRKVVRISMTFWVVSSPTWSSCNASNPTEHSKSPSMSSPLLSLPQDVLSPWLDCRVVSSLTTDNSASW